MPDAVQLFLSEQYKAIDDKIDIYIAKEQAFFRSKIYFTMIARSKIQGFSKSDLVWKYLKEEVKKILIDSPESFVSDIQYPYIRLLGSLKQIKENPSLFTQISFNGLAFIDIRLLEYSHIGKVVPTCVLQEWVGDNVKKKQLGPQKRLRDVIISLCDTYDDKTKTFGDWEARLIERGLKSDQTKNAYKNILSKAFSARSIGMIFSNSKYDIHTDEAIEIVTRQEHIKHDKQLNQKQWAYAIKIIVLYEFQVCGIDNIEKIGSWILVDRNRLRIVENISTSLLRFLKRYRTRFAISKKELARELTLALRQELLVPGNMRPYWGWTKLCEHGNNKSYSLKTAKTYQRCRVFEYLLEINDCLMTPKIQQFHKKLVEKGINTSNIRNLINALYSQKVWDVGITKFGHDSQVFADKLYHAISNLHALKCKNSTDNTNKIIKLLTTHLANTDISKAFEFVDFALADIKRLRVVLKNTSPNSTKRIDDYIQKYTLEEKEVFRLTVRNFALKGVKVHEDRDSLVLEKMNVHLDWLAAISSHRKTWKSLRSPILTKNNSTGLKIEILPYNHFIGMMGTSVDGVCIDFGGPEHLQHLKDDCMNLVIHDEERIYLWGLLVKTVDENEWFLNNLQGSLPSRYNKAKLELKNDIRFALNQLGNVLMVQHGFNSLSIIDESKDEIVDKEPKTRKMYLDTFEERDMFLVHSNVCP